MGPTRKPDSKRYLDHVVDRGEPPDRGGAALALKHLNRRLTHIEAQFHGKGNGLRLGVIVGIALAEEFNGSTIACTEAGGRVGDDLPRKKLDPPREPLDAHTPHKGRLEPVRDLKESRADSKVRTLLDKRDERGDVGGVVLAISVDLDIDIVAEALGILVPRLHRPADAEVLGEVEHVNPVVSANAQGRVLRAVVDHNVVVTALLDRAHRLKDAVLLVVGRNYHEHARVLVSIRHL